MSHLYSSTTYQHFVLQNHTSFKKYLEQRLDQATDEVSRNDLHELDPQE